MSGHCGGVDLSRTKEETTNSCVSYVVRAGVISGTKSRSSLAESQSADRRLGGWYEVTANPRVSQLKQSEN